MDSLPNPLNWIKYCRQFLKYIRPHDIDHEVSLFHCELSTCLLLFFYIYLPREEFFLTTKVWITNAGYKKAKASIEESLQKLHTDYLDLLLIHQPFGDYYGTYRAMEELYNYGKLLQNI